MEETTTEEESAEEPPTTTAEPVTDSIPAATSRNTTALRTTARTTPAPQRTTTPSTTTGEPATTARPPTTTRLPTTTAATGANDSLIAFGVDYGKSIGLTYRPQLTQGGKAADATQQQIRDMLDRAKAVGATQFNLWAERQSGGYTIYIAAE